VWLASLVEQGSHQRIITLFLLWQPPLAGLS